MQKNRDKQSQNKWEFLKKHTTNPSECTFLSEKKKILVNASSFFEKKKILVSTPLPPKIFSYDS